MKDNNIVPFNKKGKEPPEEEVFQLACPEEGCENTFFHILLFTGDTPNQIICGRCGFNLSEASEEEL